MPDTKSTHTSATVLITTNNRCNVLRNAITSVYTQDTPVELIVVDDGSSDATSEMVRTEFPKASLVRNEKSLGIIKARNDAMKQVLTDIVFSLDDDAIFTSADTVSRVLRHFDCPRVGAVAIPHYNIIGENRTLHYGIDWAGNDDFPCSASYSGCSNAKRVSVFNALGGYGGLGRQGEERSYCLRLLAAGYVVRVANAAPIDHFPAQRGRDYNLIAESAAKNGIIFGWENIPLFQLPQQMTRLAVGQLVSGIKNERINPAIKGLLKGFSLLPQAQRKPVPRLAYKLHMLLLREGPLPYSAIASEVERLAKAAEPFRP